MHPEAKAFLEQLGKLREAVERADNLAMLKLAFVKVIDLVVDTVTKAGDEVQKTDGV
jgi:hypothetical protein